MRQWFLFLQSTFQSSPITPIMNNSTQPTPRKLGRPRLENTESASTLRVRAYRERQVQLALSAQAQPLASSSSAESANM